MVGDYREGWPDLEEEDVEHMMQATLAGLGELPPHVCLGVELQLTEQTCTRSAGLPPASKLRCSLAGAACTSRAA